MGAVEFIICHAKVTLAFVEAKKIPEVLKTFPKAGEYLKTIESFGEVTPEQKEQCEGFGVTIHSWEEFLSLFELLLKKKSDICTIMYTSGTTGDPKGVLISNNNIVTLIAGVHRLLGSVDVSDVKLLIEDIGELKPTIFCAVPRVLDRIYSGLQQKISSGGFLKSKLFSLAYAYKLRNMKGGKKHPEASPLSDKIVFSRVCDMTSSYITFYIFNMTFKYKGAGHLGSVISSMGRWRMRLEVPRAEIDEMLPLARLVSRSTDPALQFRSKVMLFPITLMLILHWEIYVLQSVSSLTTHVSCWRKLKAI
ncbi:unnamed protein product [Lactuca saligna]|uniref:AMP-dependent synthetase/ligase domain-containing protein n=1 Tax=Lactuca saligna TaxID=75948 RepID=A0AA36ENR3_LACSI|nr:unnamed protein product [Lactuca saligna]